MLGAEHARAGASSNSRKPTRLPGLAHEAIAFIAKLYAVESKVKDRAPDEKLAARQAEAVPVLGEFKLWLEGHYPEAVASGDHSAKRSTTPSATGMRWFATATTAYWSPTTMPPSARCAVATKRSLCTPSSSVCKHWKLVSASTRHGRPFRAIAALTGSTPDRRRGFDTARRERPAQREGCRL